MYMQQWIDEERLASASSLHGLKRGPVSGRVGVAILCPALEGRVVVVHGDGFNLYDTKRHGLRYGQYSCAHETAGPAHGMQLL